jgi:hypothetical protein
MWCGLINNQLLGPFILEGYLTADYYLHFLQDKLTLLLEDVPLQATLNMWLQNDSIPPHFGPQVTQYLNQCYGHCGIHHAGLKENSTSLHGQRTMWILKELIMH